MATENSRLETLKNHLVQQKEVAPSSLTASLTGARGADQTKVFGKVGSKNPSDVVIVAAVRTAVTKAKKGNFKDTTPDDLLKAVFAGVIEKSGVDPKLVGDCIIGNVQQAGAYSLPARTAQLRAGFPDTTPLRTVNRQCSSGLQAVASIASEIQAGYIDCGVGGGVESMTLGGNPSDPSNIPPMNLSAVFEHAQAKDCLTAMGMTSENVAEKFNVSREKQDQIAVASHAKALEAQKKGLFKSEIVPVTAIVKDADGNEKEVVVDQDEGPKATTMETLAKLKPAFKKGGSTTAGNASQVSDGAAAVLLMRRSEAEKLKVPIVGVFRGYKVSGVPPDVMGIGPAFAIPDLLQDCGLKVSDIDIFELNEAFGSQAVYCVEKLGIPMAKVNPKGGAIALGHPLGCTGSRQIATLLPELKRQNKKLGVVSMCIGTGMGAAGLFEVQ